MAWAYQRHHRLGLADGVEHLFICFSFSLSSKFAFKGWIGCSIHVLIASVGMLITFHADLRNHPNRASKYYSVGNTIITSIEEPPSEKSNSFRALASVQALIRSNGVMKVSKGNILIYFEKDIQSSAVQYGDQLMFSNHCNQLRTPGTPAPSTSRLTARFAAPITRCT